MRIIHLAIKDLSQILRDWKSGLFLLIMPLLFTLFFGRSFCAAVCPLGAAQDVVLWKPVKVNPWLEHALGVVPYIYLGAAVLFAATGTAFVICEWDSVLTAPHLSAVDKSPGTPVGIPPRTVADHLHAVIMAHRSFYTIHIANRLLQEGI